MSFFLYFCRRNGNKENFLVVYSHICHFCLGDSLLGYNGTFFLFRLPCFFMLSGWLFEPVATQPFATIARKKFMVQIVPTFIFLLLLAPPPEFFHQLGALKGGYWFTFVLVALTVTFASFVYARYYNSIQMSAIGFLSFVVDGLGFLSVVLWRFFLFFCVGAWMRRHFDAFIRWTSKPADILAIAVAFFAIASTPHIDNIWFEMFRFYVGGITGMWLVFTCFRLSESWLQKLHFSKPLQYVGTRTLDIYLLHYFFLPRFLMSYADQLKAFDSHFVESWVILAVSLIVLLLSLLASYIIRLSPFLGHYLFGVKIQADERAVKNT